MSKNNGPKIVFGQQKITNYTAEELMQLMQTEDRATLTGRLDYEQMEWFGIPLDLKQFRDSKGLSTEDHKQDKPESNDRGMVAGWFKSKSNCSYAQLDHKQWKREKKPYTYYCYSDYSDNTNKVAMLDALDFERLIKTIGSVTTCVFRRRLLKQRLSSVCQINAL